MNKYSECSKRDAFGGLLFDHATQTRSDHRFNRTEPQLPKNSAQLTTEQFVIAAQAVFNTSRFFPTVEEFVSAVIGDAQTLALNEWEVCVKAAARNDREMLSGLSPQGQSALHLVGGLYKLGMASEEQLMWIKKEFVSLWKSTSADVLSLPPPQS